MNAKHLPFPAGIPGYADLQVNGYLNVNFTRPTFDAEGFKRAAEAIFADGAAFFLPTICTAPLDIYLRNIDIIASCIDAEGWRKQIPGVHLEGPFISPEPGAVGCHRPQCVQPLNAEFLDSLGPLVRMVTIAAELPGAEEFIRHETARGVVVSLGHQMAGHDEVFRCAAAGAKAMTHLGNGIPQKIDRHNNAIWAGLACDDLTAMIITDGFHLPPDVIKAFVRCKGADKIVVTSDRAGVSGLPPGTYTEHDKVVVLEPSGRLSCPGTGTLAGSASTISMCMDHLASLGLLTEEELAKVGYHNAAKLIGYAEA